MDQVHKGGPWTGSMSWSMDGVYGLQGPCFVYVPSVGSMDIFWNHKIAS